MVAASGYRALKNQVRELQRMFGEETMANEILRAAIWRWQVPKRMARPSCK